MAVYPRDFLASHAAVGSGSCFAIMPFAPEFVVVYAAIRDACESPEVILSCARADDFYAAGHVMEDVLRGIITSEYIVADLTGKNPNVFYELGIAHSSKAPSKVILIAQDPDDIPFDLRQMRSIRYESSDAGLRRLSDELALAFASDAKDTYRFTAAEGGDVEFERRLSGRDLCFYTFTLSSVMVGPNAVKFAVTVHRLSIADGKASTPAAPRHLIVGQIISIPETDWSIRLDRTENFVATFTVLKTTDPAAVAKRDRPLLSRDRRSQGSAVGALQTRLNELGYAVMVDHHFGTQTERAVIEFQRNKQLHPDGKVGRLTWAALEDGTS